MDRQRLAYLALTQVPGLGPARLKTLLDACHTPLGAHSAPFALLCTVPGISRALASEIKRTPLAAGRRVAELAEGMGARVLLPDDAEFPGTLRLIADPPPVLFVQGDLGLLQRPAVAIVGSRDHSAYGHAVARGISMAVGCLSVGLGIVWGYPFISHVLSN